MRMKMRQQGDEPIGERIRRLRRERGLSQQEISGPGHTNAHVSRIESGDRMPSMATIRKIARKLGVSSTYLETGVELSSREELDFALCEAELKARLEPENEAVEQDLVAIARAADREGEADIAARAQAILGISFANWGRVTAAAEQLERAIVHPLINASVFPDALTTLVSVYGQLSRFQDAVALCERALAEVPAEDGATRTLLAIHLSQALSDLGAFERAEGVLAEYAGDLEQAEPYARARLHWSLARVATMQDERRLALRHMSEAIRLLKGTEDTVRLARAHTRCALILLWGDRVEGVGRHLAAAEGLLPVHAEATDRGMLAGAAALLAAREERLEDAGRLADEALALMPEDEADQTTALYAKGLVETAAKRWEAADAIFARTLVILRRSSLWREAALVASDRALASLGAGAWDAALQHEREAIEFERKASGRAIAGRSDLV
ncbi:MAG: helix-turn-helix domain-containing protein [Gaiellaceae bacterium]